MRIGPWLLLAALSGCCHRPHSHREDLTAGLPIVPRQLPAFDWQRVPGLAEVPRHKFVGPYRALAEQEAQCLAANNSQGAALLQQEGQLGSKCPTSKRDMQRALNNFSGLELMNKDAGTALDLYFRLAKNEAQRDILDRSLREVNEAVKEADKMEAQGLKIPPEIEEFRKRQNLLKADRGLVDAAIEKLNRLLANMIGMHGVPEHQRLLPTAELELSPVPVDLHEAISLGLGNRPELRLLRYAREESSRGNISVIRDLLKSSSSLLGKSPSGPLGKLKTCIAAREINTRRDQLDEAIVQKEREVSSEIREAAGEMRGHAYLAAVIRQRVVDAHGKLNEQEKKLKNGLVSPFEVYNARMAAWKAEADLVQEVAAWNMARTKLKKAQGLLTLECGLDYQPRFHHHLCRNLHERLSSRRCCDDYSCVPTSSVAPAYEVVPDTEVLGLPLESPPTDDPQP
ncbi:MAG: TolC family protein [Planctomycetes bacterium]|nr:TolC family protein [Planctomycetota bacterium]